MATLDAFGVSVAPTSLTLKTGTNGNVAVTVASVGGFTDGIIFGCASLPARVHCDFSPINATLPANGTVSVQLNIDTYNPLGGGASAKNGPTNLASVSLAGIFFPVGGFFGWLFWQKRRRGFSLLTILLALAVSAGALMASGCTGFSANSAVPGTYTIQVSGTGSSSYFTRSQSVTLTITP